MEQVPVRLVHRATHPLRIRSTPSGTGLPVLLASGSSGMFLPEVIRVTLRRYIGDAVWPSSPETSAPLDTRAL
jgi:hypothetical protein